VTNLPQYVTITPLRGTLVAVSGHPGSHFGTQLKKERLMRGWGLDDLAKETGINPAHLSRIESGKRPPTKRVANACDKALPHRHGWFTEFWQELQGWSEVPSWFKPWSDHELSSTTIRSWQPGTIDGLLQTEDYARAQIALRPGITPEKTAYSQTAPPTRKGWSRARYLPTSKTFRSFHAGSLVCRA
jgi:transcriptional regulator with XRE-family HTH domain